MDIMDAIMISIIVLLLLSMALYVLFGIIVGKIKNRRNKK